MTIHIKKKSFSFFFFFFFFLFIYIYISKNKIIHTEEIKKGIMKYDEKFI